MIGNDRFGRSDLLPSECERLFRDRAYGIDVVKINALQFIYGGINVPWHGDIDDEERAIQALPQHRREYLGCQQRRFRCCRREQNVDLTALRRPIIERHGAPAYGLRQLADRKSTRLNSSHMSISYAVFCLKKKKKTQ